MCNLRDILEIFVGSRGGAVLRTLASHPCGLGSNPGSAVISGLSLLLVLVLVLRVFLPLQISTFLNSSRSGI